MTSPFWTVNEAALYLRFTPHHVRYLTRTGDLPSRKHGGKVVILKEDVLSFSDAGIQRLVAAPQSRFQQVRHRLRSLTTESAATSRYPRKGAG